MKNFSIIYECYSKLFESLYSPLIKKFLYSVYKAEFCIQTWSYSTVDVPLSHLVTALYFQPHLAFCSSHLTQNLFVKKEGGVIPWDRADIVYIPCLIIEIWSRCQLLEFEILHRTDENTMDANSIIKNSIILYESMFLWTPWHNMYLRYTEDYLSMYNISFVPIISVAYINEIKCQFIFKNFIYT